MRRVRRRTGRRRAAPTPPTCWCCWETCRVPLSIVLRPYYNRTVIMQWRVACRSPARSRAVRRERFAMRYPKDQKQATRQRILEAAARRFKQDGIDAAGVAAVMSDAGLTNGAFYAHFASKEDLGANVLAEQLRVQRQSFDAEP